MGCHGGAGSFRPICQKRMLRQILGYDIGTKPNHILESMNETCVVNDMSFDQDFRPVGYLRAAWWVFGIVEQ